jgi:hypothetical protein
MSAASASQRLRPHSPLWLPRQPAARHFPAALLSTTRSSTAIADRTRSLPCPGTELILALSQMWRPHGGHRETYGCPDPTPFSTLSRRSRRMIRPFPSPSPGASDHLPPWCALLAPNQLPISNRALVASKAEDSTPQLQNLLNNPPFRSCGHYDKAVVWFRERDSKA